MGSRSQQWPDSPGQTAAHPRRGDGSWRPRGPALSAKCQHSRPSLLSGDFGAVRAKDQGAVVGTEAWCVHRTEEWALANPQRVAV